MVNLTKSTNNTIKVITEGDNTNSESITDQE